MTIKEFSEICECNPQTLRYYDKIGLLVPAQTDPWTGYRYYDKNQALTFVKIKSLQEADFSIDEIQNLLSKSNEEIYNAFSEKIKAKEEQLERIRTIQQSYLAEQNKMKEAIKKFTLELIDSMKKEECSKEFGLSDNETKQILDMVSQNVKQSLEELDNVVDLPIKEPAFEFPTKDIPVKVPGYKTVYEKNDWAHAYEFINELPSLDATKKYKCIVKTAQNPNKEIPFSMMIVSILCNRNKNGINIECNVCASKDSKNHVYLLES